MKITVPLKSRIFRGALLALFCTLVSVHLYQAQASGGTNSGGSTDTAGSTTGKTTSGGGSGSGGGGSGGGGGSTTTTSATTLVFTQPMAINGVVPVCAGTYSISPYYPTLYLLTAHVGVSSMNVPDGSLLSVKVNTSAGTILTGYITVTAQTGTILLSSFCAPSTVLQNVTISDSLGNVISTGQ